METKSSRVAQADGIREVLRDERVRRRLSQGEAASSAGLTRKWLSEFERGVVDPSLGSVLALSSTLGVRIGTVRPEAVEQVSPRPAAEAMPPLRPSATSAEAYLQARRALFGEVGFEAVPGSGMEDGVAFARFMSGADAAVDRTLRARRRWLDPHSAALADLMAETMEPRVWRAAELAGHEGALAAVASARVPLISEVARMALRPSDRPRAYPARERFARWLGKADMGSGRPTAYASPGGTWNSVETAPGREEARIATGRALPAAQVSWAYRENGGPVSAVAIISAGDLKEIVRSKGWKGTVMPELPVLLKLLA